MKQEDQRYKPTQAGPQKKEARREPLSREPLGREPLSQAPLSQSPHNREPVQRKPDKDQAPLLDLGADNATTIPVIEEELRVQKRKIETGSLDIYKKVTEEDITVDVPYVEEELEVKRIAINKYVDTPPPPMRTEGDTTIIPVLKEVVVKRLVLVEEVHIKKRKNKQQLSEDMTLRKEEVHVKRNSADSPNQGQV